VLVAVLVNILAYGMQMGLAILFINHSGLFAIHRHWDPVTGWLGALAPSITALMSPVIIGLCRRKSTRLTGVIGGLVSALGCLFTSFANHFHQIFFSYGIVIGVGVCMIVDTSTLMVGQYFKRRREFVEIFLVSARGIGISIMYFFIHGAIRSVGWRHGLQALTGVVFSTFILGIFYRSATLYHPQRRAILHLKTQKRKIKDKNKSVEDTPPFFDLSCLKSRTVQIILLSTGVSACGVSTPLYYLVLVL
jgi:MFS family permease